MSAPLHDARILVVDDQEANVALLERVLAERGYRNVVSTTDSSQVVALCADLEPDIILLDLQMPRPDGFELMEMLDPRRRVPLPLPILVLTADVSPDTRLRALSAGAKDFLTKPFDVAEVALRVENLLESRAFQLDLHRHNELLESRVRLRTRELERARIEVLERLALAAEFRDDETNEHAGRVGRTAELLARELGLDEEMTTSIRRAAPLHDVGKIGISDTILLKPGKLTPAEYELMKSHAAIGAEILGGGTSGVLQLSAEIALTHHERWDGGGYPAGLGGEAIPLSGRIVALADVFDALTHKRPYKPAWSVDDAVAEIRRLASAHFDPRVVEAFAVLEHRALLAPLEERDEPATAAV